MERNENNNFRIFFHSLVWEFKWEGMVESPFLYLGVKVGENGMSRREHSFLSIPLKPQIFIPSEIGRNGRK